MGEREEGNLSNGSKVVVKPQECTLEGGEAIEGKEPFEVRAQEVLVSTVESKGGGGRRRRQEGEEATRVGREARNVKLRRA